MKPWNSHYSEHIHHLKMTFVSPLSCPGLTHHPPVTANLSVTIDFCFAEFYINGIIRHLLFYQFFHSSWPFWDSSLCVSIIYSLYCWVFHCSIVYLSIYRLMDICIVFSFGPLHVKMLWTLVYKNFLEIDFLFSWVNFCKWNSWIIWLNVYLTYQELFVLVFCFAQKIITNIAASNSIFLLSHRFVGQKSRNILASPLLGISKGYNQGVGQGWVLV